MVENQFGPRAEAYVTSLVHAHGEDLTALAAFAKEAGATNALDLGCGGGHVTYALAPVVARVTACDLSAEMLAAVAATARSRRLDNIATQQAAAERLPFTDAAFDFLGCRFSAHHWHDFEGGLREARRVLRADASAVFIDAIAPRAALLDTHLQAIELLRDTSHVRDYTATEWVGALARAGFAMRACRTWRLRMDFPVWIARMNTPEANARAIRALQAVASESVTRHFGIETDGSFQLDVMATEVIAA